MSEPAERAHQARANLERLRALLARGATLREAAQQLPELDGSQWRAYRLAVKHNLPRRRRGLPRHKSRQIEKYLRAMRLTINAIAKRVRVSTQTVWKRKIARDGPGPRTCRPYWCPGCHKRVNLKPCQICRALGGRDDAGPDDQGSAKGK